MMEFVLEKSPWELALEALRPGDSMPAAQTLVLLEEMSDTEAEEALLMLEERGIALDVSGLPADSGSGETAGEYSEKTLFCNSFFHALGNDIAKACEWHACSAACPVHQGLIYPYCTQQNAG